MRAAAFLLAALCAGCAGSRLAPDVLDLARSTAPAGAFHLEFGPDGRLLEAGSERTVESVPVRCRDAVDAAHPGGRQTGAERVASDGERLWMVAKQIDGRGLEILVDEDGRIRGGEEQIDESAWPSHVVAAARAAVPGAKLLRVERVWGSEARGAEAYHVKFDASGDSLRVGLAADGTVVRIVRRIAGQVRIER